MAEYWFLELSDGDEELRCWLKTQKNPPGRLTGGRHDHYEASSDKGWPNIQLYRWREHPSLWRRLLKRLLPA